MCVCMCVGVGVKWKNRDILFNLRKVETERMVVASPKWETESKTSLLSPFVLILNVVLVEQIGGTFLKNFISFSNSSANFF